MAFKPQVHIEPYKANSGAFREYVELHTYDDTGATDLALVTVRGSNSDDYSVTVDLWLTEAEVRSIRDGLNNLLKEE